MNENAAYSNLVGAARKIGWHVGWKGEGYPFTLTDGGDFYNVWYDPKRETYACSVNGRLTKAKDADTLIEKLRLTPQS